MSVGLLIITHEGIGQNLLSTATKMLGSCPLNCQVLAAEENIDPDILIRRAKAMLSELDTGDGVLILTDMFGATPSNVASKLTGKKLTCVSGINLPMLVRVLNYKELDLNGLTEKAHSGGIEGVTYGQQSTVN